MNRQELISRVMTEVRDEGLRDELLRILAKDEGASSALLGELSRLGFNPQGAQEFISFSAKTQAYGGIVASAILMVVGIVLVVIGMFILPVLPIGIIFTGLAVFSFVYCEKLLKAVRGR